MKLYNLIFILFIILLSVTSCTDDDAGRSNQNGSADRIILAYFGADNDLSEDAEKKIDAMMQGRNSVKNGRLFVFLDTPSDSPELFEIVSDKNGSTERKTIRNYGKTADSADPEFLSDVITFITNTYQADSYGLIVFSHASGWLPVGTLSDPYIPSRRSIIIDKENEMDFLDFASSIPDNTFNFIILEACYMAGIEVAYELKDKAEYIIASSAEIIEPGFRNIYKSSLNYLFEVEPDLTGFARNMFEYFDGLSGSWRSATISVIKTSALDELEEWMIDNCSDHADKEIDLNKLQKFNRSSYKLFFDFGDYYSRLIEESKQYEFQSFIDHCVIYRAATPEFMENYGGFTINKHSGLTSYVPNEDYPYLNEQYKNLSWYKNVLGKIRND